MAPIAERLQSTIWVQAGTVSRWLFVEGVAVATLGVTYGSLDLAVKLQGLKKVLDGLCMVSGCAGCGKVSLGEAPVGV